MRSEELTPLVGIGQTPKLTPRTRSVCAKERPSVPAKMGTASPPTLRPLDQPSGASTAAQSQRPTLCASKTRVRPFSSEGACVRPEELTPLVVTHGGTIL